jgi:hypothetical protein
MHKFMTLTLPDGSVWGVPIDMIALHRAKNYAREFDGDVQKSLNEDTLPLFESDTYAIHDYAAGNMNWSDFDGHQQQLRPPSPPNFERAWLSASKGVA